MATYGPLSFLYALRKKKKGIMPLGMMPFVILKKADLLVLQKVTYLCEYLLFC